MIRVDRQAGSVELIEPLMAAGLPVEPTILPSGDVEIIGRGPEDRPLLVGVEFKRIPDVLTCVRDGRFATQLREMQKVFEVRWLLVEGEWEERAEGLLYVRERRGWAERGKYTYQEVAAWLLTMTQCAGVLLMRTRDRAETVAWLRALYWWWTHKAYERHDAHLAWYTPPYVPGNPFEVGPPSVAQKVAAALLASGATVDVGSERAKAAAEHFRSARAVLSASAEEWQQVPGIGKKLATAVQERMNAEST